MTKEFENVSRSATLLLCTLLLSACAAIAPSLPADLLQFYVSADGWYRVDGTFLQAAGVELAEIDPRTFQLLHDGHEVAIHVQGEGGNLMLDFYGQASDSPYSSSSVYQLRWGKGNGKRISDLTMPNAAGMPKDSFQDTLHITQPTLYIPQAGEPAKPWFWQALTAPATTTIPLTLQSALSGPAQVHVDLWGNSEDVINPDHHIQAYFDEMLVGDETWDGQGAHTLDLDVPIREDSNSLRLILPGDTQALADVVLLRSVDVTYARKLVAQDDSLEFRGSRGTYRLEGFSRDPVDIFDITDPSEPRRVASANGSGGTVTLASDKDAVREWSAVGGTGYKQVARIVPLSAPNLMERTAGADYVVVTHPDFVAALEPLIKWRRDHGLKPAVATTDEIYAAFGYGEESPLALRAYLDALQPKPRYVLLIGKASYDYRDDLSAPNKNLVPTFLLETPHLAQAGSDNWFAAISSNDPRPSFAIGRIPAKSPEQVTRVVDKIIRYESTASNSDWKQNALFITDNKEESFAGMTDALVAKLGKATVSQKIVVNVQKNSVDAARADILERWNAGALVLTYVGHGSIDTWAEGPLFSTDDLPQLTNADRLPILFTPTCLDGFFYHPQRDSLAEELLFKPDGGIIAGVVPTGLSVPEAQSSLMSDLFEDMFDAHAATLGEAVLHAKLRMNIQDTRAVEVVETFGLIGDPALQVAH